MTKMVQYCLVLSSWCGFLIGTEQAEHTTLVKFLTPALSLSGASLFTGADVTRGSFPEQLENAIKAIVQSKYARPIILNQAQQHALLKSRQTDQALSSELCVGQLLDSQLGKQASVYSSLAPLCENIAQKNKYIWGASVSTVVAMLATIGLLSARGAKQKALKRLQAQFKTLIARADGQDNSLDAKDRERKEFFEKQIAWLRVYLKRVGLVSIGTSVTAVLALCFALYAKHQKNNAIAYLDSAIDLRPESECRTDAQGSVLRIRN